MNDIWNSHTNESGTVGNTSRNVTEFKMLNKTLEINASRRGMNEWDM